MQLQLLVDDIIYVSLFSGEVYLCIYIYAQPRAKYRSLCGYCTHLAATSSCHEDDNSGLSRCGQELSWVLEEIEPGLERARKQLEIMIHKDGMCDCSKALLLKCSGIKLNLLVLWGYLRQK